MKTFFFLSENFSQEKISSSNKLSKSLDNYKFRIIFASIKYKFKNGRKVHFTSIIYSNPKPSELSIAIVSLSASVCLLLYAGSNNWLKHVCAIGNLKNIKIRIIWVDIRWSNMLSDVGAFMMVNLSCCQPQTGILSPPVQKWRNCFCFECDSCDRTCHRWLTVSSASV